MPHTFTVISVVRKAGVLLIAAGLLSGCGLQSARQQALEAAAVTPLTGTNNWMPGLVGMPGYKASGLGPKGYPGVVEETSPGQLDPAQEFLSSISMQAGDLQAGVSVDVITDGDSLKGATLDFCGGTYPSEAKRLVRRQVAAFDSTGAFAGLSTEAVQYESPEAAQQAIDEIVAQKKNCPDGHTYTDETGVKHTVTFFAAPGPSNTVLVPSGQRAILHMVTTTGDTARRTLVVYQVRGNTFLGIYASETGDTPYSQSMLDALYGLVSTFTKRLVDADPVEVGLSQ